MDAGYLAAVGQVTIASAVLEHALHEAVEDAVNGPHAIVRTLVAKQSIPDLVAVFAAIHPRLPDLKNLCRRIRADYDERNFIVHGSYRYDFGGPRGGRTVLVNRKKGDKEKDKPSKLALLALAGRLRTAAETVTLATALKDFGYSHDEWEKQFEP